MACSRGGCKRKWWRVYRGGRVKGKRGWYRSKFRGDSLAVFAQDSEEFFPRRFGVCGGEKGEGLPCCTCASCSPDSVHLFDGPHHHQGTPLSSLSHTDERAISHDNISLFSSVSCALSCKASTCSLFSKQSTMCTQPSRQQAPACASVRRLRCTE